MKYHGALLCAAGHKIYKMSSLDFVILAARFRRSSAVNFLKIHPCTFLFSEFSEYSDINILMVFKKFSVKIKTALLFRKFFVTLFDFLKFPPKK